MNHMYDILIIFLTQLGVCALFILSCYGWGAIVRGAFWRSLEQGFLPASGMAVLIALGGWGTLLSIAVKPVILSLVGVGVIAGILDFVRKAETNRKKLGRFLPPKWWFFYVIVLLSLAPLFLSPLFGINQTADKVGYVVHIARLLETGVYGPDPFNSRIIESSLGGFNFLAGLLQGAGLPFYQLWVLERFLAPIITILGLLGFFNRLKFSQPQCLVAILSFIALIYLAIGMGEAHTLTGTVAALPIYLLFLRWLHESSAPVGWRKFLSGGITLAALLALKNTHFVIAAIFLPAAVLLLPAWSVRDRLMAAVVSGCMAMLFLIPYMINMYLSSGTFLYPFLGAGFHGSVYGIYYKVSFLENLNSQDIQIELWKAVSLFAPILLLGVPHALQKITRRVPEGLNGYFLLFALFSTFASGLIIVTATGFLRYAFVSLAVAVIVLLLETKELAKLFRTPKLLPFLALWVILTLQAMFPLYAKGSWVTLHQTWAGIARSGVMNEPVSRNAVLEAQAAIPEGDLILARMGQAYYLDFSRNSVWHLDIPGASSPPPGLPLREGASPKDLADYLRETGVRFIMYSEIDDGGHNVDDFLGRNFKTPWMQVAGRNIVQFDELIRHLGVQEARLIYRKEGVAVFDLDKRSIKKSPLER